MSRRGRRMVAAATTFVPQRDIGSAKMAADELQRGRQIAQPECLVVAASEDPARHLMAGERGEPHAEQFWPPAPA